MYQHVQNCPARDTLITTQRVFKYGAWVTDLPGVLCEAPLVGLQDLLPSRELELRTPKRLYSSRAVVVLRAD